MQNEAKISLQKFFVTQNLAQFFFIFKRKASAQTAKDLKKYAEKKICETASRGETRREFKWKKKRRGDCETGLARARQPHFLPRLVSSREPLDGE